MSKKNSTFATDLGIVPTTTIKKVRVMKKDCIFKACKGDEWWYLYRYPNATTEKGCIYRVYCGRKWYDHITWFDYEMALGQLLGLCLGLGRVSFRRTEV